MKKTDLVAQVAESAGITKSQADAAVAAMTSALVKVGEDQDSLTLSGLGTFKGKTRPGRVARNPATGEAVNVAEKKILTFKMSSALAL